MYDAVRGWPQCPVCVQVQGGRVLELCRGRHSCHQLGTGDTRTGRYEASQPELVAS